MGRYRDNAPVGNTCGDIDNAISSMESVRSDNEALREWGNELFDELEIANNRISDLETEVECLEEELGQLKAELEEIPTV